MCQYCENNKKLEGDLVNNIYTIQDKTLDLDMYINIYDDYGNHIIDSKNVWDSIEINYCPMCGRKLT